MPQIISIYWGYKFTLRCRDAAVSGSCNSAVFLVYQCDSWVTPKCVFNNGSRFVGGPVVHNDKLEVLKSLCQDGRDCLCNSSLGIIGRDDDRHIWIALHVVLLVHFANPSVTPVRPFASSPREILKVISPAAVRMTCTALGSCDTGLSLTRPLPRMKAGSAAWPQVSGTRAVR